MLEIAVLRGAEEPPAAASGRWAKVRRDVSAGKAAEPSYLACRVGVASNREPPIVAVTVLKGADLAKVPIAADQLARLDTACQQGERIALKGFERVFSEADRVLRDRKAPA